MFTDFIDVQGNPHGPVANTLMGAGGVRFDPGMQRPFLNNRGEPCVTVGTGKTLLNALTGNREPEFKTFRIEDMRRRNLFHPSWNAVSLRKEDWINLDRAVVRAARLRLRLVADLMGSVAYSGINGMSKVTHEYETMTDPGEAIVDMDGLADGRTDSPLFKLRSVPLPITHSDFWFSERRLAVSRNSDTPLDTTMAEAAGRRVAEMIEKTAIGIETGVVFGSVTAGPTIHDGTSAVWGMTNFPYRITKTDLNTPDGTNPYLIQDDLLEMIDLMNAAGFFGPFVLYHSTSYTRHLNSDYFRAGGTSVNRSVRERLMETEGLQDIRRLDYLTSGYQLVLLQLDPSTVQMINAMDITTVQWDSRGGMQKNFKVMAIQVPLFKAPSNGVGAIVHATTS